MTPQPPQTTVGPGTERPRPSVADRGGTGQTQSLPAFLITVDTEGDNLWSRPRSITVRNAQVLPRFQGLCEKYALKPTYLANWEMVRSEAFVEFGAAVLMRGTAEIGMHLHAWNSPPLDPLTADDYRFQPYLIEFPPGQVREKVRVMTAALEDAFDTKMLSHRAGRWGLDAEYVRALVDSGYRIDCSVTPHVDWRSTKGDPDGRGGPDFRAFPERAYLMDPTDISRPGSSPLLEVPVTILSRPGGPWAIGLRRTVRRIPYVRRIVYRHLPAVWWLSPNGRNIDLMRDILTIARDEGRDYVELAIHSSELMAGGSPTFPTQRHIERLFDDLEALFDAARGAWAGLTLSEFRERWDSQPPPSLSDSVSRRPDSGR